ncbi:MAG: sulfonate/nitrate/taurine transporter extracellular binding protein [Bradyrhizobium sp.]|jgi:NitT/TauT family transport system substrate-binding protein|nr:sulfonate/nitrate/taurine transporter extracellular binding protein [Bradyrhizobium sp.]
MIAGELDVTNLPTAASLFNSVAKGAPLVVFSDWGHNEPSYGYTSFSVFQKLHDERMREISDLAKLKGKKIGVGALGSINQDNKAGLNPATDVEWRRVYELFVGPRAFVPTSDVRLICSGE